MTGNAVPRRDSPIRSLTREVLGADDPQIMRIVATVDAMTERGQADLLIEPLRARLAAIQPRRPLRFSRLLFFPLDQLIVPAARWRPGQHALPRSALMPLAEQVNAAMDATAIKAEIAQQTTGNVDLISRLGLTLWPAAAAILTKSVIPDAWEATGLGQSSYRPLADAVATLLAEAATLDGLQAEAHTRLLPPRPDVVAAMMSRVARRNVAVLPMMLALLLDRLPNAGDLLALTNRSPEAAATHAAMDAAADLLLRQFDQENGIETRIAVGSLAEAGAAAGRIAALLKHFDTPSAKPQRRERVRAARQRLDADCRARFAASLADDFLAPLQRADLSAQNMPALEAAARGLRVLESEARMAGGGSSYDLLLSKATEAVKSNTTLERLSQADQIRLVEILSGPDAALAMLNGS